MDGGDAAAGESSARLERRDLTSDAKSATSLPHESSCIYTAGDAI